MNEELAGHAPGYDPQVGGREGVEKKKSNYTIWVFPKIRVPQNGWFIMENPRFGGTIIFGNTHIEKRCCEMLVMDSSQHHEIVDYSQRRL